MILLAFFIISALISISIILVRNKAFAMYSSLAYALLHIALAIHAYSHLHETELIYFTYDTPAVLLLAVLSVLILPTLYHGFIYVKEDNPRNYSIYHAAMVALIAFMTGAYLANGMMVLWIFVEATTLAVAALIYHDRTETALEATWKYVFICSIGIAIAYIGILFLGFIYGRPDTPLLAFGSFTTMVSNANPLYLKIAFVFVLVGFSTKMGLFPMHTVTLDAHAAAPPPVSALISTTLMNVGFLAIFRVYSLFSATQIYPFMNNALILSGIFSLLISAGYMLKAKHIKRMLAYSSLENMGLAAIALGVGGKGYYAAFLLLVLHTFSKSSLFYHMGQFRKVMGTYKLDDSGRYMRLYPAGGLILLMGMVCILAIPPSGLFLSEFMVFNSMVIGSHWAYLIITAILLSCVIYAFSTRIMHVVFSEPRQLPDLFDPDVRISPWESLSQFVLLGLVMLACFYQPQVLVELINGSIAGLP